MALVELGPIEKVYETTTHKHQSFERIGVLPYSVLWFNPYLDTINGLEAIVGKYSQCFGAAFNEGLVPLRN